MKKVLLMASEAVPFIKTGGLADVIGALPRYIDKKQYDMRVMMPAYACIEEKYLEQMEDVCSIHIDYDYAIRYVGVRRLKYDNIIFYFIDNKDFFSGNWPYENEIWDIQKFIFFSLASLSVLPTLGFRPDIIHCNDWQTGMVPVFLKERFKDNPFFKNMKTIFTIHNLRFQGSWDLRTIKELTGLSDSCFSTDKLEAYGNGNLLKGGLVYADKITTVSKTYVEEIKTPQYGERMEGLLCARSADLVGIINGIDTEIFNPETDTALKCNYSVQSFKDNKKINKKLLQERMGLPVDENKFLVGIISRLTSQKGLDLVECVLDEICNRNDMQLIVSGVGEERYENLFRHYAWKYPDRICANIYYKEELSHWIYAACDALLMPSQFEPCGLSQLIALRYGTIPIVRETGGLADTVEPYNEYESSGTGFSFANYNAHEMLAILNYAKYIYYENKEEWNKMVVRAMESDFSWHNSIKQYEQLYKEIV